MTEGAKDTGPEADAGWVQGVLLAIIPATMVMSTITVVPIIPKLLAVFSKTAGAAVLVPLIVVTPILAIAISGVGAGALGERIGRRRLLEIGTALFAITAILPFWLSSLPAILAARAVTGVALGAMTTSGVGLTGDYFSGETRRRWLAIQGGVSAGAGVIASAAAGALGDISWRYPFLLLAVGFPFLAALLLLPARHAVSPEGQHHEEEIEPGADGPVPWATVAAIFALGVVGSLILFPPAYELGLVFQEKKLGAATLTGIATAILAAGGTGGALAVDGLSRLSGPWKMAIAFALGAAGTVLISAPDQIAPILLGSALIGASEGALNPILSIWLLDRTPALARGRIVGLYSTIFYLAQFAAPLAAGWLAARSASVSASMLPYGVACAAAVVVVAALSIRRPRKLASTSASRVLP